MHRLGPAIFEDQFATMEQCLLGIEKAVGELKGLQAQMVEFQTSQDSVVVLLTHMVMWGMAPHWIDAHIRDVPEE